MRYTKNTAKKTGIMQKVEGYIKSAWGHFRAKSAEKKRYFESSKLVCAPPGLGGRGVHKKHKVVHQKCKGYTKTTRGVHKNGRGIHKHGPGRYTKTTGEYTNKKPLET